MITMSALSLAVALHAGLVSSDTSLTAALVKAVDTTANAPDEVSLSAKTINVDMKYFLSRAGSHDTIGGPLPINWQRFDQAVRRGPCAVGDTTCIKPDQAFVRLYDVRNATGRLYLRGMMTYWLPHPPQLGEPKVARSNFRQRLFTVELERTSDCWVVVQAFAMDGG